MSEQQYQTREIKCSRCKCFFSTFNHSTRICLSCSLKYFLGKRKSDYPKCEFEKFTLYFKVEGDTQ